MTNISPQTGRPCPSYTSSSWAKDFATLKAKVIPSSDRKMRKMAATTKSYDGQTSYNCYCDFINDILHNIRSGETDYCFSVFQIIDILRFEPAVVVNWSAEDGCFYLYLHK